MIKKTPAVLFIVPVVLISLAAHANAEPNAPELLYTPPGPASAQNPAYSPDGKTLIFTEFFKGYNAGGASLNRMPSTGGAREELVRDGDQSAVNMPGSAWNGPTGLITFSYDITDRAEIWTLAPGGAPQQVKAGEHALPFTEPTFSPNGDWIVFQENTDQNSPAARGSIWKIRPNGEGLTKLVDGPATNTDNRQPNWSPRGDKIIFQSRAKDADQADLIVMSPDGTNRVPLLTGPDDDTDASFSPDGTWVVYSTNHGGAKNARLYITRSDGTGQPIQVTNSDRYDGAPSWSPDGAWIVFESGTGDKLPTQIWRVRVPALS
ncbi:TolB family protein [Nocardia sp. NPDC052566]|uniref:TolB family protein n=1 Tax=Nocardia sp. NPDC052566 TaxID=3364330 RepID=UPI0037CACCDE